jgi:hypothetical protein
MPQLIFYTMRVLVIAVALAALGVHYLLHPLSKPVVLVIYGIMGLTWLIGLLSDSREKA